MSRLPAISRRIEAARLAHEAVGRVGGLAPLQQYAIQALHVLIDEASQDYALGQIPSPLAVASFGRFLQQVACSFAPAVSLTPSGGIWAEWSDAVRRNVAIFVGQDGRARLGAVLMVQEACRLPLLLELEGDLDSILERLQNDRDLSWVRTPLPACHPEAVSQPDARAGPESGA